MTKLRQNREPEQSVLRNWALAAGLGVGSAEALGCLRANRVASPRRSAVQSFPSDVVHRGPETGRPRDLLLFRGERPPPEVLICLWVPKTMSHHATC